ncbi:fimbrial protein [Erwinia psidii]|uniref:Type 1 fimbrial protein n=1 Tax=Erwinia psidii TaxID=69224 RepID=A0A3N6SAW2_9GAMM|nr:fimbrial protein [Erwinia psidii]MCX8957834.1 type 1 fimbrial protein [Erwinia psidii]MCX8960884.1 type 1 fimbrial protein [Erwinia psidii]MCX8964876.1 type 1 fimbrial protein [Erwinia psidii]RQM38450.1 type 1 fimbrial protein [Erwinia psidii]
MKYATLVAAMLATCSSVNVYAVAEGTITFNGTLQATTCNSNINGGDASGEVALPIVGVNQLATQGQTAGQTEFSIGLTDCAGVLTTAAAFFEAGDSVDTNGRLIDQNDTAEQKVAFQLRNAGNQSIIVVGNASQQTNNTYGEMVDGNLTLPYMVEYYANSAAGAGVVTSYVTYSVMYK